MGLPERDSVAGNASLSRVNARASSGTPRCDAPSTSSEIVMRGDEVSASRCSAWLSSALLVKVSRIGCRPGVS